MLFNSYIFLFVFLPLVLVGWWRLAGFTRLRLAWLTLASYVFYAYYQFPRGLELLPLLLASTTTDFIAGRQIARSDHHDVRRRWLVCALTINLGLLFIFKYLGFFEGVAHAILALGGVPVQTPIHDLVLPIGISFYTFNSMSYTIDIYRREVDPAPSFLHYSTFVALFPHLVAGPIVRFTDIDKQLRHLKAKLTSTMFAVGLFFLTCGLVKKLLFADTLSRTVDRLYISHEQLSVVSGWAAALGYSLQLYFDFSAYSDMAVGLAMMMGIRFPQNFNSPYKAANISECWRRWHITLSRWLRDYVFVPLGGSNGTKLRTLRNIYITFVLAGLWHGAAWTFIWFGIAHATALSVHAIARSRGWWAPPAAMSRALTYIFVVLTQVPFRSPDMGVARNVFGAMFGMNGMGLSDLTNTSLATSISALFIAQIFGLLVWVNLAPNTWEYELRPRRVTALAMGAGLAVSVVLLAVPSPFLYFQF